MSESSPKIQALFENEEYKNLWQPRLTKLDCDLKQEMHVPVFQQLMGSYLAFFYHKWVTNGYDHLRAAKDILTEVENRGVQNPFTSERPYTLLVLPAITA